jgi:hypothetical protein
LDAPRAGSGVIADEVEDASASGKVEHATNREGEVPTNAKPRTTGRTAPRTR